jgi:5-methylcytosine-specific restriction endonuclease McrA
MRNLEFTLTKEEFKELITNNCNICDSEPKMVKYRNSYRPNGFIPHNGIDRINNNKGYTLNNVQTMCTDCNRAKSNLTNEEFLIWIEKIVEKALKDKSYLNIKNKRGVAV